MQPSIDAMLYLGAALSGLLILWLALRTCPQCGHLARQTMHPTHRCPSHRYSRIAHLGLGIVGLWTFAVTLYTVVLGW
jgi:hypothetical protein